MSIERILSSLQGAPAAGATGIGSVGRTPGAAAPDAASPIADGFGDTLTKLVDAVDTSNRSANAAVTNMANGSGDVHDAMIALQRADMTLQLTVQIRNKLIQAYQDIMRMPL